MLNDIPRVTQTLLIINVVFYLLSILAQTQDIYLPSILGSFYPESVNFKIWQPLTHMFMHGDTWHIFFNMFALYMFGSIIERAVGQKRFLALYFIAGFSAFFLFNLQSFFTIHGLKESIIAALPVGSGQEIIQNIINNPILENGSYMSYQFNADTIQLSQLYVTPMVGASGAIYGLLAAFGFLYPNERLIFPLIPIPVPAKIFIPILLLIEFSLGIFNSDRSNIAHFAHIGGALAGVITIFYWRYRYQRR